MLVKLKTWLCRILLSYIKENWDTLQAQFSNKEFENTLEFFLNTSLELESEEQPVSTTNEFIELKHLCKVSFFFFSATISLFMTNAE